MVNFLWDNLFRTAEKENDLKRVLKENYLFEPLSEKELGFVTDIVHVRNFRPGETIFRQGEVGLGMYIIWKGAVDIYVEDLQPNQAEPTSVFITRLSAGDFFGELSLVEESGRRPATATTSDESTLVGFFKPDLIEIAERNPSTGVKIALRLSEVLGRRLKETTKKVSELKRQIRMIDEK